jgi:hypothetical protein
MHQSTHAGRVRRKRMPLSIILSKSAVGALFRSLLISSYTILFVSFQRRETANVEIVQTEKKGFGIRAAEDILK